MREWYLKESSVTLLSNGCFRRKAVLSVMKLGFIGAGNMGSAIISGILNKGALPADCIYAVGRVSGTPEKGLNLDVARRLAAILEAQGAQVVMTRTDDYALCDEHPPIRKKLQDMQRRAAIIEQSGAQMVLSIHMNEYAGRSQSGPQVFYREGCPAGRLLAGAIQEAMNETLAPKKKRSALGGDYYILTLGRPSVLVECGFLSNAGEEALLLTADYRQRVAQAIARGIWAWANLPEEKPEALPAVERGGEAEAET